ncbi:MAG: MarR family transcriptional regulator [Myxococcota bacterium]
MARPHQDRGNPATTTTEGASHASDADSTLAMAQREVSDVFGNIAAFWGFTRTQGRIFGLLFLSPEPLPHGEIRERLGISTGSTSMTLASLQDWGVVHRQDRLYVAETDLWKLITGVFRRRERAEVVDAITRMGAVVEALAQVPDASPRLRFARARAESLHEFFRLGKRFLDAFVARGSGASKIHQLISALAQRSSLFPALLRPSRESRAPFRL